MRGGRSTAAIVLALAAVVAVPAPANAATLVRTTVDPRERSHPIAPHFLGISAEVPDMAYIAGNAIGGYDGPLEGLLRGLGQAAGTAPLVRVGGGSADRTWWNPGGLPRPPGVAFDLLPEHLQALAHLHAATGVPYILTLNLLAGRPELAASEARAMVQALGTPAIRAFELGNEPDIYPHASVAGYGRAFVAGARAVRGLGPGLAGPDTCCAPAFDRALPRFLAGPGRGVGLVTLHHYPQAACGGQRASVARLLAPSALDGGFARLQPLARAAHRRGLPIRLTETNASACGGVREAIDTYAAALWSVDWSYTLAALGFEGVNFHLIGTSPFAFSYRNVGPGVPGQWEGFAGPLYYGMLLTAHGLAGRARMLFGPTIAARPARGALVRVWATVDGHGTVRVTIVNRSARRSGTAVLAVKGRSAAASVLRLRGDRLDRPTGVTFGGRAVATPTLDGRLVGRDRVERVARSAGAYRVWIPAASAALVTIPGGGR
jgi:hypothetical protein